MFILPLPARKRFCLPAGEESPPKPVRLFHRRAQVEKPEFEPPREQPHTLTAFAVCNFCLQAPCITSSVFKPQGQCNARITNHTKRRKDYKWFWKTLKGCGLWEDLVYIERKQQLGCLIDDVREVMPHCVVKDVRDRWPNPPNIPYQGDRRS